nr:MAG: nonstructural protein [Microvirus sp.]
MKAYTVYDSAAQTYSLPIYVVSRGAALRSFMDEVAKEGSALNAHPEHYSLFELGEFSQADACFSLSASPQLVANAWELQK